MLFMGQSHRLFLSLSTHDFNSNNRSYLYFCFPNNKFQQKELIKNFRNVILYKEKTGGKTPVCDCRIINLIAKKTLKII